MISPICLQYRISELSMYYWSTFRSQLYVSFGAALAGLEHRKMQVVAGNKIPVV
jgi:hypothetical protein